MSITIQSLIWAAVIIVAAWISSANGLGNAESFAMVSGLTAAAYASIMGRRSSGRRKCKA